MAPDQKRRIDVYLAGKSSFTGDAGGIEVRVHPGPSPDDPNGGPSAKASNFVQVFRAEVPIDFARQLGRVMRLKAGKAVIRGRVAASRRHPHG